MPSTLVEADSVVRRNALRLLTQHGVFKLGEFFLKSGQRTPIYIDMREAFGHPALMSVLCKAMQHMIERVQKEKPYRGIVGVPYAALPYATILSQYTLQPLIIVRKEAKSYGTKKLIEGACEPGQRVIIVEDVVVSGESLLEVITTLRKNDVVVEDVFCLFDRDQGGKKNLADEGVTLHSLLNMETALAFLYAVDRLTQEQFDDIVTSLHLPFKELTKIDVNWEMEEQQ
ncbi:hypothetical protein PRIPAC_94128 [Pristionchus pacificus]|uniref:orotate phosphoribosyltransferase n=1 Tax=Pristionchus pacificus TaxID=54126 RepID=A0A454Y590_PRIPA|nr:hypothetical protein PRIPAC_94128 [Pristionchus pacificus]|eukprot:PDM76287.1 hypothetical protein PRIPAC_39891 [Pristionchus pacificus]